MKPHITSGEAHVRINDRDESAGLAVLMPRQVNNITFIMDETYSVGREPELERLGMLGSPNMPPVKPTKIRSSEGYGGIYPDRKG